MMTFAVGEREEIRENEAKMHGLMLLVFIIRF